MSTILFSSPIFGPVHSRRLGVSLGVNLLPADGKLCTFDCIYCECGFNGDHRTRSPYPTREEVARELEQTLERMQREGRGPDVITFAGNGEPTMHPEFADVIDDTIALRDHYFPEAKISVLSNATFSRRPAVFAALCRVDNNILKLATVSAESGYELNFPIGCMIELPRAAVTAAHVAEEAQPNAGHIALAEWEQLCDSMLVTTQNIDNLHERAGSQHIAHLHGSLFAWRCSICGRPYRIMELPTQPAARLTPPECPLCHNPVRPGVVWFGESLPQREWELAEQWMMIADVVVVVGTSGVVYPAAALPRIAYECGTPIIEISPAATDLTPLATVSWATTAAQGLPELVAKVQESRG